MPRRLLHFLAFLASLLGAAGMLRSLDVLPFWSWTRQRIGALWRELGSVDVVFFGSSRVQYGIVPATFDARLAELGLELRSVNVGLAGTRPHDTNVLVSWVVSQRPARLRAAVIELHSFSRPVDASNWMTDQELESHTVHEFGRRLRSTWLSTSSLHQKVEQAFAATLHMLVNQFRIGQGPRILDDLGRQAAGRLWPAKGLAAGGYVDIATSKTESVVRAHAEWLANEPRRRSLMKRQQGELPAEQRGGYDARSARAIADELRSIGVVPVFVVMPSFAGNFLGRDGVAELAQDEIVIELDVPAVCPELADYTNWHDQSHLARLGAEACSRRLAELFAAKAGEALRR